MKKVFFIIVILCSCKLQHDKQELEDPILRSHNPEQKAERSQRPGNKAKEASPQVTLRHQTHLLNLHDYSFNENSDFVEVGRKALPFAVKGLPLKKELVRSEARRQGKRFSGRILQAAKKYDVTLADITESGYFYDVQTQDLVQGATERCFFTAFDYETGVFFSRSDFWVAPFFTFLNLKFNVLISGQLCVDAKGRIKTYKNNGPLSMPGVGLENFVSILLSRGISFVEKSSQKGSLGLAGAGFLGRIKALMRRQDSVEMSRAQDMRKSSDILNKPLPHVKSASPRSQGPLRPSSSKDSQQQVELVGGQFQAVPVRTSFNLEQSIDPKSRNANIAGLLAIDFSNFGKVRNLNAPESHVVQMGEGTLEFAVKVVDGGDGHVRMLTLRETNQATESFAIKTFRRNEMFEFANKNIDELYALGESPHFLKKYGVLTDAYGNKAIIYEGADVDYLDLYLNKLPAQSDPKPVREAILDLFSCVDAIHSKGRVHWDIKLENFMVTATGQTKIIDLDGVSVPPQGMKREGKVGGSRGYQSPERLSIEGQSPYSYEEFAWQKADVYALGISMMEILHKKRFAAIFRDVMDETWENSSAQLLKIRNGSFQTELMKHRVYGHSGPFKESKTLLKMIDPDPARRISLNDARAEIQMLPAK